MKYRGRLSTPEQFGNIVIHSLADGQVLRLRDVERVELGSDAYNYHTGMDEHPTAMLTIQQTAGRNASAIINEINAAVKQMSSDLPEGIHSQKINDAKHNVAMALLTSTIVFMAVFIPVSMIGGTSGAFYRQFGLIMAVVR